MPVSSLLVNYRFEGSLGPSMSWLVGFGYVALGPLVIGLGFLGPLVLRSVLSGPLLLGRLTLGSGVLNP
jgi:hypothetical protein